MSDEQKDPMTRLAEAAEHVKACTASLEEAMREEQTASRAVTDARNRMNGAQKAFDALVAEIRKAAPRNSDWWEQQHSSHVRIDRVVKVGED